MPVAIDYNLCDGVEDCPAVRICDAEALYSDHVTRRVEYSLDACRNCGTCANYCAPGAMMHAPSEEEWAELTALLGSLGAL